MKEFLNLIRWKNLLIIIATMVLMRYLVVAPLISAVKVTLINSQGELTSLTLQQPLYEFLILVTATIFIAAAGYVINDYFDIKTDLINRGKVIVGTRISRQKALMWHNTFNIIGVASGFYVSYKAGYFLAGILFLLVSGLLYFYSASYKRQFLIGNIIVSVLTSLVPMMVVFFEWPALYKYYAVNAIEPPKLDFLFYWMGGFALFAFLSTLIREIIKDVEDFEGDKAYGRKTIPVVTGIPAAKVIATLLIIIMIVLLYLAWNYFIHDNITLAYISAGVVLPLLLSVYRLYSGNSKRHFHIASNIMKITMLSGILYSVVIWIIITWRLV